MRWMMALALLAALAVPVRAADVPARCERVVDGDTLVLRQKSDHLTVRLAYIDAPEADQPGGREATAALRVLTQGRMVEVKPVGRDRYGRLVAAVSVDGRDLSTAMLDNGHAWHFRAYDDDPGRAEREQRARTGGRGIWATPAVPPWSWRAAAKMTPAPVTGSCIRRSCRQMSSCGEARRYLAACSATWLDRDGDGTPCEALCH